MNRQSLRPSGKLLKEDGRRHHRALVLQHLFSEGPASRADLARASGLTRVTVSDLTAAMIDEGLLAELGAPQVARIGKPPTLLGIDPDASHILAVDLSAEDHMVGTVQDLLGTVKSRVELRREGRTGEQAVELVLQVVTELKASTDRPLLGIGVGSPGVVSSAGVVLDAPNLAWKDLDLADRLRRECLLPAYVANDANTAALGEHTFGGSTGGDFMLIRIANGVGAGLVLGGGLVEGHTSAAGEIGHVVVPGNHRQCACGRTGCLETLLAEPALRGLDERARSSVGQTLGDVLAPIVGVLNLHEIVLAGPRSQLEGPLVEMADRVVRDRTMANSTADFALRICDVDDVILAGAAVLVLSGELGVS